MHDKAFELTDEQLRAIDGYPPCEIPRMIDPRTSKRYLLIPDDGYDAILESIEEERTRRAFVRISMRNAAKRMMEEP